MSPSPDKKCLVSTITSFCAVTEKNLPKISALLLEALRKECQHFTESEWTHWSHHCTWIKIRTKRNFAYTTPEGKKAVNNGGGGDTTAATAQSPGQARTLAGASACQSSPGNVPCTAWLPLTSPCCSPNRSPCRSDLTQSRTVPATGFRGKS